MDALRDDSGIYLLALGERLKIARQARNRSQTQVASVINVSRAAVSQWEAGQVEARLTKLRAAAFYLEISPSWLLTGEGRPFTSTAAPSNDDDGRRVAPPARSARK